MTAKPDIQYTNQRKKLICTFNEEDLFNFFRRRLQLTWDKENRGKISTESANILARQAWKTLPLNTLEGLIVAYKNWVKINRVNPEMKKNEGKQNIILKKFKKKCEKCGKKCKDAKFEKSKVKKIDKSVNAKEENKCGKKDSDNRGEKNDPSNIKKKKAEKGKCKDDDKKCGEKRGCGNCSKPKSDTKGGCKKDTGKCPDKKDDGKKGGSGKCGDLAEGSICGKTSTERFRGVKRRRTQSDESLYCSSKKMK